MKLDIVTMDDLQQFKTDFLQEMKGIIGQNNESQSKHWLRSSEVREMLKISPGTLQNLRINGTLPFRKVGGIMYYSKSEMDKIIEGK